MPKKYRTELVLLVEPNRTEPVFSEGRRCPGADLGVFRLFGRGGPCTNLKASKL